VRVLIQVTSALLVAIGLILVVRGAAESRWFEVLIGLLFVAAGAGRLYVERAR
jgi:fucose permease